MGWAYAIRAGRMRYAPTSSFYQSHNHLLQAIGMGEDVIQGGDFILLLLLCIIKKHEVFLAAVEVEAADGFAVVVRLKKNFYLEHWMQPVRTEERLAVKLQPKPWFLLSFL